MANIELREDWAPPARITFGQTLLRIALGVVLIAHGTYRLFALQAFQDELASRYTIVEPALVAQALLGVELLGGLALILGWFTRLGSLALLCSALGTIHLELLRQFPQLQHSGLLDLRVFELPMLLAVGGLYCLLAGGGAASVDELLRERARRKAIQRDDLWLRHPYVPADSQRAPLRGGEYDRAFDYHPSGSLGRRIAERR